MIEHAHFGGRRGPELVIARVSASNALGLSAHQSWAFRRAELTCYSESPFRLDNGSRATMGVMQNLPPRSVGASRMMEILRLSLSSLLETFPVDVAARTRLGLALGLPERFSTKQPSTAFAGQYRSFERELLDHLNRFGGPVVFQPVPLGHASLGAALLWAARKLTAGQLELAIVGGVDSYYDPEVVEILAEQGRIFDGKKLDSFIPSEGAALFVLCAARTARQLGLSAPARLETVSVGEEPSSMLVDVPSVAAGMTHTVQVISDRVRADGRKLKWLLGDLTNEDYRCHEVQLSFPRYCAGAMAEDGELEFLPAFFGDLGAATMPTGIAIACEAFVRGDPAADNCVVMGSSVGEDRAAVLISKLDQ